MSASGSAFSRTVGTLVLAAGIQCPLQEASAQSTPPPSTPLKAEDLKPLLKELKEANDQADKEREAAAEEQRAEDVLKKYFGAGIFANFDFGATPRIKSARVVNGIVRVEEESRGQVGFLLEAHRFYLSSDDTTSKYYRGIFVGVVANAQSVIDAVALGHIWGFRQKGSSSTLNVGVALSVTPRAQVLGDGLKPNEPLPPGETEIRYKYETLFGLMVMTSFGF